MCRLIHLNMCTVWMWLDHVPMHCMIFVYFTEPTKNTAIAHTCTPFRMIFFYLSSVIVAHFLFTIIIVIVHLAEAAETKKNERKKSYYFMKVSRLDVCNTKNVFVS